MSDGLDITFTIEDKSQEVLKELDKATERALYYTGTKVIEGSVNAISGKYNIADKAVDTGRLRASLSFITPEQMSGRPKGVPVPGNADGKDILVGKAEKNSVIFGTNVEYATYVHNGTHRGDKEMKARPFLRIGVDNMRTAIKNGLEKIFKGEL